MSALPPIDSRVRADLRQPVDWWVPPEQILADERFYADFMARREPRASRTLRQRFPSTLRSETRCARDEWVRTDRRKDQPITINRWAEIAILVAGALFVMLASTFAHAVSPLNLRTALVATDDGLYIGTNCYSASFKVNAVDFGANGGTITCGLWRLNLPPTVVDGGTPLPNFALAGVGIFHGCRFLEMTFAGTAIQDSVLEVECRDADGDGDILRTGFEARP